MQTHQDLAGVLYWISGDTSAELLFSATQYAVEQLAGGQRRCPPVTWVCPRCGQLATGPRMVGRFMSSTAMPRVAVERVTRSTNAANATYHYVGYST